MNGYWYLGGIKGARIRVQETRNPQNVERAWQVKHQSHWILRIQQAQYTTINHLAIILVTEKILSRDPLEEIRKAFKLFDEDGTGRISLRNLRHIALELGENIDDDELRAMIDEFDLDGDGEINEQEFIAIMAEASR